MTHTRTRTYTNPFTKTLLLALFALFTLSITFGQTVPPVTPVTPVSQPTYVLAFGGGASQATDPHYAMTGSFGVRVADGLYELTSLDMATTRVTGPIDAKTGKPTFTRVTVSTIRTGAEKLVVQQGPLALFAHADAGLQAGGGNMVGSLSGGGTVTYDIPKHPNLFVYGTLRILKSPQNDPTVNPATVLTAFSAGIGLKLK